MIDKKELYRWCSVPAEELLDHPERKVPLRIVEDGAAMGELMARDFVEDIKQANVEGRHYRAIVPCGPKGWYEPFCRMINEERVSLKNVEIFHMDECLDWQGGLLAKNDPFNFRTFMEKYFYEPIDEELAVLPENRHFLYPEVMYELKRMIAEAPIDYCLGGWGQDGHVAYNQARRSVYSPITLEELREASIRVQENNVDTILALAQRTFGTAWQFVPPMSITLGVKECFSAKKVRVYSDTGAWKQTALRVALFSEPTVEFPMTLLQEHPDALLTATKETTRHPISENPEWEFAGVNV